MRVAGLNLETDADVAVFLRNVGLMVSEVSRAYDVKIDIHTTPDKYIGINFGEYAYHSFTELGENYEYRPMAIDNWKYVTPQQVNLKGEPHE